MSTLMISTNYIIYILFQETCKRYGQHLPIIENLNEQDFIKSIMEPMHVTSKIPYFMKQMQL